MPDGTENGSLHVIGPTSDSGRDYAERALQIYLAENPSKLGIFQPRLVATEYQTDVGRVDLLFESYGGDLWVVELKAGIAGRDAIGQVISYMGSIAQTNPGKQVFGMLVAPDFDKSCLAAHSTTSNLELRRVHIEYRVEAAYPMKKTSSVDRQVLLIGNVAKCSTCGLERTVSKGAEAFVCAQCKTYNKLRDI